MDSKDPDIHVLDKWMLATKTHLACTIHKDGMWLPQWLEYKTVTYAKISPKMVNPRDIAGERRRRSISCRCLFTFKCCSHSDPCPCSLPVFIIPIIYYVQVSWVYAHWQWQEVRQLRLNAPWQRCTDGAGWRQLLHHRGCRGGRSRHLQQHEAVHPLSHLLQHWRGCLVSVLPFCFLSGTTLLASWLRRRPREPKIRGSNPDCDGIFLGRVIPVTLKMGTPVATLPGAWHYSVSAGTGQPGVSILWLGEVESLMCNFYLCVAARKIVWTDLSLRYTSMLLGR